MTVADHAAACNSPTLVVCSQAVPSGNLTQGNEASVLALVLCCDASAQPLYSSLIFSPPPSSFSDLD
jgi:hypothetical protein